ncbi:MAG TPA: metal-dependent transcriptional regulator [Salinimicrobium sp.]|nr:metal-dependent transcriptional regulator [Salinimicrobium sp.]
MTTFSEENYLKSIFHLEKAFPSGVGTNVLAEEMETKASSVTDMLKKLSDKNLVEYKKYQGVKLSASGKVSAIEVVRKHRLWELFLVEKLNFGWDEVHDIAEQLEHIKSKKLTYELDKFLGFPTTDPHGDPIPDSEGRFKISKRTLLAEMNRDETCICIGVRDSSAEFLQYLDRNGLGLGTEIKIIDKESFDQSIYVQIEGNEKYISSKIANNLYVKRKNE